MNIQIYGVKKCFDTQKAERFFKERRIKYQFIDILRYPPSKGELESMKRAVGINSLIDPGAKEYRMLNLHIIASPESRAEILLNNPKLYITPVVRNGKQATVGYKPEVWSSWE